MAFAFCLVREHFLTMSIARSARQVKRVSVVHRSNGHRTGGEGFKGKHPMPNLRVLLASVVAVAPAACAEAPSRGAAPPRQAQASAVPVAPAQLSPTDFARQASPSLWGVVARGPGGEEVRGSAVAVS